MEAITYDALTEQFGRREEIIYQELDPEPEDCNKKQLIIGHKILGRGSATNSI